MDCQIVLWLSNIAAVAIRNFNVESEELILKKTHACVAERQLQIWSGRKYRNENKIRSTFALTVSFSKTLQ